MDTYETKRLFSRRRFLAGGAASGGFLLLAACGGAGTATTEEPEQAKEAALSPKRSQSPSSSATRPGRTLSGKPFNWSADTFREMNPQVEAIEYTSWRRVRSSPRCCARRARKWGRDLWDNGILADLSAHIATAPEINSCPRQPLSHSRGQGIRHLLSGLHVMVILWMPVSIPRRPIDRDWPHPRRDSPRKTQPFERLGFTWHA